MKAFILNILVFVFLLTSCEKVFKDDLVNRIEVNNIKDLDYGITGLYTSFCNAEFNSYFLNYANTDDAIYTRFDHISTISTLWGDLYKTVISSNFIIAKCKDLDETSMEIRQRLGEAYFLRGYTYFRLARYFGKVPIIEDIEINYNVKMSSYQEVYNFILSDMEKAMELLPANNNQARLPYVTPHRGTVKAMLAEIYLTMGGYPLKAIENYEVAARYAKEVIDSAGFFGYEIVPDFADLWNRKYLLSKESVFSYYAGEINLDKYYNYNIANYEKVFFSYPTPLWFYIHDLSIGKSIYQSFPNNYRKKETYRTSASLYIDEPNLGDTALPEIITYNSSLLIKKNYYALNNKEIDICSARVIYILRYAEILLTYAEAKARTGDLDDQAYESVNIIRRRANKLPLNVPSKYDIMHGLTPEQFADSVVLEKAFEFCAEPGNRHFDLLRLERFNLQKLVGLNPVTKFFPIPESDIILNPKLKE